MATNVTLKVFGRFRLNPAPLRSTPRVTWHCSTFWVCGWNLKVRPFTQKPSSSIFLLFITPFKVVLAFESADQILKCYHWNDSYRAVLFKWMFSSTDSNVTTTLYSMINSTAPKKVLLDGSHSNDHTFGFHPQTQHLQLQYSAFFIFVVLPSSSTQKLPCE